MNPARTTLTLALVAAAAALAPASVLAASDIPGRGTLPDNRGYELVSPPDKNGGNIIADVTRTRPSTDGGAVNFASLTGFGDVLGTGIAAEYIARRTGTSGTNGWATHSIIPRVDPLTPRALSKDPIYIHEFSDDLTRGVLHTFTPQTNDPKVAMVSNLYLRNDALTPGFGSYTLLSSCPACSSPLADNFGYYRPQVAAATANLDHIIFEAARNLTSDAPPQSADCNSDGSGCEPRLYEWDHGTLRLAGILPNGDPAPSSIAGLGVALGAFYAGNALSPDGSKVVFTAPASPGESRGDLYVRSDHAVTAQLNASERTVPDPAGPQPAKYQTTSPDGTKVFFTSPEQLTDDDGSDLYVYDTTLPADNPHNLKHVYKDEQPLDSAGPNGAVLGTSRDGSYVYFSTQSAILPDQAVLANETPYGIYVSKNGEIKFIGATTPQSMFYNDLTSSWAARQGVDARVTPDGRTLIFSSLVGSGLTGYDHGNTCTEISVRGGGPCSELYRYNADSGVLGCVSCNPSGAAATADATFSIRNAAGSSKTTSHLNHPMTDDGSRVFFETNDKLLPQDTNGKHTDVYQWRAIGVEGCSSASVDFIAGSDGCLSLLSPGTSNNDAHFLDATANGDNVFFVSDQQLVGWDVDNNFDLYDARVGGGFPEPRREVAECGGDACQGAVAESPAGQTPPAASLTLSGAGNVVSGRSSAARAVKKAPKSTKKTRRSSLRARRLQSALKVCRKKPKRQRAVCEARAHKRLGPSTKKAR